MGRFDLEETIRSDISSLPVKGRFHPAQAKQMALDLVNTEYRDCYMIYTDGSKCSDGSGAAYYDPQMRLSAKFKIQLSMSIMEVELIAIYEALCYCQRLSSSNIVILTDSKSALRCIKSVNQGHGNRAKVYNIIQLLQNNPGKRIRLQWIPSHSGIEGNEMADSCARSAVVEGATGTWKPFYTDMMPRVKQACLKQWSEQFTVKSVDKGIWYHTMVNKPFWIPWFICITWPRKYLVEAFRLRTGHLPVNRFKHMIGLADSPNCPHCNCVQDLYHVTMECTKLEMERCALLQKLNAAQFVDVQILIGAGGSSLLDIAKFIHVAMGI